VVLPADSIRRIVVLAVARRLDHRRRSGRNAFPTGAGWISVTLIESRLQPPIGVGEGTWPTIRSTLKQIGVTETDFLRECEVRSSKARSLSAG